MRQWWGKILLALVGLIMALILVEVGLRLLGIEYPNFYDYDPHLGNKLRPGVKGRWLTEGGGYVSINSDGLRDREHDISKPPNTLRIAVLGDSFTEAMQVNREEIFWAIMEKDLRGCKNLQGRNIEVINFGQSGFGTTQELLALKHRAWKHSPDLVLLAFFVGNDVTDNSRALKRWDYHPYHVYRGDKLVLDDRRAREVWEEKYGNGSWLRQSFLWSLGVSRVMQLFHQGQVVTLQWWSKRQQKGRLTAERGMERGLWPGVFREPSEEVWKEAWRVTEGVLKLMHKEITQKGAEFLVVVLSTSIQVHPDPKVRDAFAQKQGIKDLFYPERRLEDFCQRQGIPVLLLGPDFQAYATRRQVFFHGFGNTLGTGHWNQKGHRLAAEVLTKWLCTQIH